MTGGKSVKYLNGVTRSPLRLVVGIVVAEIARGLGASVAERVIWEEPHAVFWTLVTRRSRYEFRWYADRGELMVGPRRGGNLELIAWSSVKPLRLLRIIKLRERWA